MYTPKKLPMSLLPKAPGLKLQDVAIDAEMVSFSVESTCLSICCPVCGQKTARLHSRYYAPSQTCPGADARSACR